MSEAIEIINSEPETIELGIEFDGKVSARDAEAWAVGKRGGVDVAADDPTYQNNAKYYSQFAEQEAQEAIEAIDTAAEEIKEDTIDVINRSAEEARRTVPGDYTELCDRVKDLEDVIDLAPSEDAGAELLKAEVAFTELFGTALDEFSELPTDETLSEIYQGLAVENEYLEVLEHELAARLEGET